MPDRLVGQPVVHLKPVVLAAVRQLAAALARALFLKPGDFRPQSPA